MNLDVKRHISHVANETRGVQAGAADLAPGWIITPEFGSRGGEETETASEISDFGKSVRRVVKYDDPELRKTAATLMNVARRILWNWCAPIYTGLFFCPANDFAAFDDELNGIRMESYALNALAKTMGSNRKTMIEIFPSPHDTNGLRVAIRVGQTLYQRLVRMKESIASAETSAANRSEWRLSKNIHKLVVGEQHAIVKEALRSIEDQRAEYGFERTNLNDWNFAPIDRAIKLFEPAKDAFLVDPNE
jgi:hypothetical protein